MTKKTWSKLKTKETIKITNEKTTTLVKHIKKMKKARKQREYGSAQLKLSNVS